MKTMIVSSTVFLILITYLFAFELMGASPEAFPFEINQEGEVNYSYIKTAAQVTGFISAVVVESVTPPELTVPPDITIDCFDAAATNPDNTGWATATSNCGNNENNPVLTFDDTVLSGLCPQEKVITRIWTATDDCANTATSSQIITIMDRKAPHIYNLTAEPTLLWPPNHKMIPVNITCEYKDNCDPLPRCRIIAVENNQPQDACGDADTELDWEIASDLTVNLRAERAGCRKEDRIYTIIVQCTDCKGNRSSQIVKVKVTHDDK